MEKLYRQGDVLLKKIKKLPIGLRQKDKILAYGEVTGHKHQFRDPNTIVFIGTQGRQFVQIIDEQAVLEHEEHENQVIPRGEYEVIVQREYDLVQGVRTVMD